MKEQLAAQELELTVLREEHALNIVQVAAHQEELVQLHYQQVDIMNAAGELISLPAISCWLHTIKASHLIHRKLLTIWLHVIESRSFSPQCGKLS